ncbi:MAG: 1-acyl-sn-glycerol-3-phosphate acyltransferase [Clostridia bacterium]|nr:1-acyl-sn-glycerol-3-phosphate acyltransferase [Clostridia bacterium]
MQKKKGWLRFRHRIVRNLAYLVLYPYSRIRYGIRIEKCPDSKGRQFLILLNHQTPFDQFFVGMSFRDPVYYLASEDIFSNGWISGLIRWLVAPIPIKKQTMDIGAIRNCLQVVREGGTLCIAPEGNRTYSGKTEYMNPSIAGLARRLGLPIVLYRIEGGYGAEPRWSDCIRRGKVFTRIARIIQPEEYAAMDDAALFAAIREGLFVDDTKGDPCFTHRRRAEFLERAIYICPRCGLSKHVSREARLACTSCGNVVTYGEDLTLSATLPEFPFRTVSEWYDWQKDYINAFDPLVYTERPIFSDGAEFSEVIPSEKKVRLLKWATVDLYGDRVVLDAGKETEHVFSFADCSAFTVLGRNKLNIYLGKQIFQLHGDKRFNALKYVHIYNRTKNIRKGESDGQFLGL